jgi:hypothetical protein
MLRRRQHVGSRSFRQLADAVLRDALEVVAADDRACVAQLRSCPWIELLAVFPEHPLDYEHLGEVPVGRETIAGAELALGMQRFRV